MKLKSPSIVLYDFLLVKGGAEAVTLDLCEHFEELSLGVGFIDETLFGLTPVDKKRLHNLTRFTPIVGWQILKSALFFRYRSSWLAAYKTVIFSGHCAPMSIAALPSDATKLMYCHTPPRFIYDLKNHYLSQSSWGKRALIKLLIRYMKPRYETAMAGMDLIIANSINVKKRIEKYLGQKAIVIYPPCHTDRYSWIEQGDFYLSTARVEGYKRVDVIVKAFMKMPDKKLVVASGGSELNALRTLAKNSPNIEFTGWCPQSTLEQLMGKCIATLYLPLDEDFGMSPVESMAAGKPVIGVQEGGVIETVKQGETGVLCAPNPSQQDVMAAVEQLTPTNALLMREQCEQRAAQFSHHIYLEKMGKLLTCERHELADVAASVDASSL